MTSSRKRLEALTAGLTVPPMEPVSRPPAATPDAVDSTTHAQTRFPPAVPGVPVARTGPGQMMAFRGQMIAADTEIAQLKERLEQHAGSLPTRKIDAELIQQSAWANRHAASYRSPDFTRLKEDIQTAGGNVQPILVRPLQAPHGHFEIVFGHRRHRACAELRLPVLATIWTEPLSDAELLAAMDRENRERADLSPFEQGIMYQRALDEHVYTSQRRLAEALGVSHTWVQKALTVAQLPEPIVECFETPLEIQYKHAEQIGVALEVDRRAVLKRADKLRGKGLAASAVVNQLINRPSATATAAEPIRVDDDVVGTFRQAPNGDLTIKIEAAAVDGDKARAVLAAITKALAAQR